jgi:hypothetical protein
MEPDYNIWSYPEMMRIYIEGMQKARDAMRNLKSSKTKRRYRTLCYEALPKKSNLFTGGHKFNGYTPKA